MPTIYSSSSNYAIKENNNDPRNPVSPFLVSQTEVASVSIFSLFPHSCQELSLRDPHEGVAISLRLIFFSKYTTFMLFIPTLPSPGLTLELHADIPNYLLNVYIQISKPFCKLYISKVNSVQPVLH